MGSGNAPKNYITAYIIKDCAMAIFFQVRTMMNADKIVKLSQSIW